ncbi:MAG: DUF6273 domain-containing protein [Erysipelotrichaceae bacterium]|jgi:hypothetical protein|nr:DUF6273 domain-containing protein [Erysipelotrichaceae bacterium]
MKKNVMTIMASSLAFLSCLAVTAVVFLRRNPELDPGPKETRGRYDSESGLLTMGSFPQTVVSEDCTWLIPQLDLITTTNTRGYIEYEGEEYARVVAAPDPTSGAPFFDSGAAIVEGDTYYFKVEPIKWRVLDADRGVVLSDILLEPRMFSESLNPEWIYSTLRSYLNNDWFYGTFTEEERGFIFYQEHAGDMFSGRWTSGSNDWVYLPSASEYMNPEFGFSSSTSIDAARTAVTSDYARAMGCSLSMNNTSIYYTRSGASSSQVACLNADNGEFLPIPPYSQVVCVRPAIIVDVSLFEPVIVGEYTRGDIVVDVSNSIDPDDPRGTVSFYFEILDETWTDISLTMLDEEYFGGFRFVINHYSLTVDTYVYYHYAFILASDLSGLGIEVPEASAAIVDGDLYLTLDQLAITGYLSLFYHTTIHAINTSSHEQIIEDCIYLNSNADHQKTVINYLHGEVRVNEDGSFTLFIELNNLGTDLHWTRITYEMIPVSGNSPIITHEITNRGSYIEWIESHEGDMPPIDLSDSVTVSNGVISIPLSSEDGKYLLNERWDLTIIVYYSISFQGQIIRNELILRPYAPIISDYTSGLVEIPTTSIYNYYEFEFADLSWTKIEILAVSRGTNEALAITIINDKGADRVLYDGYSRLLGSTEADRHILSMSSTMNGNMLSLPFNTSKINTGPLFDLSITVQNETYSRQNIETSVQYVFNQPFAPLFFGFTSGDLDIIEEGPIYRLNIFLELQSLIDCESIFYSMTSISDPALRYSFILNGDEFVFNTYYENVLMNSYDLSLDVVIDHYSGSSFDHVGFLIPVDEALFRDMTFNVTAIARNIYGGVQYQYGTVTWH